MCPAAKPARKTTLPKEVIAQETLKLYMKFAASIVQDQRKVWQLAVETAKKLRTNEESFKGASKDIKALIRLLKAWSKDEYTNVQPESVTLAVAIFLPYRKNPPTESERKIQRMDAIENFRRQHRENENIFIRFSAFIIIVLLFYCPPGALHSVAHN